MDEARKAAQPTLPSPAAGLARAVPSRPAAETPVVPGFYPDPTICRVGSDYYLAHSSFEYFPAVPVFHSANLVEWTLVGHVLTRRSQFLRGGGRASSGIYAGTLRHRADRFWYVTTNVEDMAGGQLIVWAPAIAGPWSDPVRVRGSVGIDPDLCWDDDGTCYLTWKAMDFNEGEAGILQVPVDLETGELLSPAYPVWQGTGLAAPEAPHLYSIDGTWYLLLAEGGTERGHAVTVARGPHPSGPFEACPQNPILTHRSTQLPVQNVGHADLVQTQEGGWAMVYLGVRARGSTPGFHVLGRETFLAGVDWADGWPLVDEQRYQVLPSDTAFYEDFATAGFHPRWVVPGGEPASVARRAEGGGVAMEPSGLLATRVRDLEWTAAARISGEGRLELRIDDRHWYGLVLRGSTVDAVARIGNVAAVLGSRAAAGEVTELVITCTRPGELPVPRGHGGPDEIILAVEENGATHELARLDGRYLSTEVAGGFTGRMLAVGAGNLGARVHCVSYRPKPTSLAT